MLHTDEKKLSGCLHKGKKVGLNHITPHPPLKNDAAKESPETLPTHFYLLCITPSHTSCNTYIYICIYMEVTVHHILTTSQGWVICTAFSLVLCSPQCTTEARERGCLDGTVIACCCENGLSIGKLIKFTI